MKKGVEVTTEVLMKRNRDLRLEYTSPLIKWFQATMSKADKFKYGLMSPEEYNEWQEELARAPEKADDAPKPVEIGGSSSTTTEEEKTTKSSEENTNHTFWEDDDGDRENLSASSYENFLEANNINVSNKNSVDVDSLINNGLV